MEIARNTWHQSKAALPYLIQNKIQKSKHFHSLIKIFAYLLTQPDSRKGSALIKSFLNFSEPKNRKKMASTACFLHHHAALSTSARTTSSRHAPSLKPTQVVCRAQKQAENQESDSGAAVMSRRLALTVLIGAAAVGTKVSPADAAYGESGSYHTHLTLLFV